MKAKKIYLLLFFLFSIVKIRAQIIHISGRVEDNLTKNGLSYATISAGDNSAVADSAGNFTAVINTRQNQSLKISRIGYIDKFLPLKNIDTYSFLIVGLEPKNNELLPVNIVGKSGNYTKKLLQKAIEKIPENYIQQPFNLKAYQDSRERIDDSIYTFNDNAILNTYYNPLEKDNKMQIQLLQNKQNQFYLSLKDSAKQYHHWMGGNMEITLSTIIYNPIDFIDSKKLDLYHYDYKGILIYHNRIVNVIDFKSKKDTNYIGTLFIDTTTKAFVEIYYRKLIPKIYERNNSLLVPYYRSTYNSVRISYALKNDHWVFNNMLVDRRAYFKESDMSITSQKFAAQINLLSFDAANAQKINRKNLESPVNFQYRYIVRGNPSDWDTIENNLRIKTINENYASSKSMRSDSSGYKPIIPLGHFFQEYIRYFLDGGFRISIGLSSNNYSIDKYNSSIPDISQIVNYGLRTEVQFKLYRGLFFNYNFISNYGIGNLNTSNTQIGLSYDLNMGNNFFIIPTSNFSFFKVKQKDDLLFKKDFYDIGTKVAYMLGSRLIFVGAQYSSTPSDYHSTQISLTPNRLMLSLGITLRFIKQ